MFDKLDRQLIAALRHNARAPVSSLATQLGWSRATVRARMARLEEKGEVLGYTVVLKSERVVDPVRGLMMVEIEGRGADRIIRQLNGMPEVRHVYTTNGRWDVIIEIGSETLEAFDDLLYRVRRLDGIKSSETSLLLSTRKSA